MSNTVATILATIISAVISIGVAVISYMSAKAASENAIKAKLDELRQGQLTEVLHQRIERYPSLWKLCQGSIAVPDLTRTPPPEGWDQEFARALEGWHAEHGVFLSEDSYRGIWRLRQRARFFAAHPTTGEPALGNLRELNEIWTRGFIDDDGTAKGGFSALLKNDLGSYGRAALSIPAR
jgi:hypothetical protein